MNEFRSPTPVAQTAAGRPSSVMPKRTRLVCHERRLVRPLPFIAVVLLLSCTFAGLVTPGAAAPPDPDGASEPTDESRPAFVIVEGQVFDAIGAGQAGVEVTVRRASETSDETEVIATAVTDELGDFQMRASEAVSGAIVVTCTKEGFAPSEHRLKLDPSRPPPFLAVQLEGDVVVVGRVRDALMDEPVGAAAVTLKSPQREWHARTATDGAFEIRGVFPGRGELIALADGYGRERLVVQQLEDAGEIVIRLKPERIVHLHVVDEADRPVAGAAVEMRDPRRGDFRAAVTDEEGTLTWRGVHFDTAVLKLRVTHDDYVGDPSFGREVELPDEKHESSHKLIVKRAARITGKITDAQSGDPVRGARVVSETVYTDRSPRDFTDPQGRFTIAGVPPGEAVVTVHARMFAPDLKTVSVSAGDTSRVDFALASAGLLFGMVRDEDGEPIADALVRATKWRGHATLGLQATTNPMGMFFMAGAPLDEFEITVMARGYESVTKTVQAKPKPDQPISITLAKSEGEGTPTDLPGLSIGDPAPDVTMTTLEGRTIRLSDLKGKVVLLDFWATWCAPCIAELPQLARLYEKFGVRDDFVLIGINRDFDEKTVRAFLTKRPDLAWPEVFDDPGGEDTVAAQFGVNWLPRKILIGRGGTILESQLAGEDAAERIEQALAGSDKTEPRP